MENVCGKHPWGQKSLKRGSSNPRAQQHPACRSSHHTIRHPELFSEHRIWRDGEGERDDFQAEKASVAAGVKLHISYYS